VRWLSGLACCAATIGGAAPCRAYDVLLRWTVSPGTSINGYRIYSGANSHTYSPPLDAGLRADDTLNGIVYYLFPNLSPGQAHYLAVTAYEISGLESNYSNEKVINLATVSPPTADAGLDQTAAVGTALTLGAPPLAGINYFWRQTGGPPAVLSNRTSSTTQMSGSVAGIYTFTLIAYDAAGVAAQTSVRVVLNPTIPNATNIGSYAILPAAPGAAMTASAGTSSDIVGSVCAYTLHALTASRISADAVGLKVTGSAVRLGAQVVVNGNVTTGGGEIVESATAQVDGVQSSDGDAAVDVCLTAAAVAEGRGAAVRASGRVIRDITVPRGATHIRETLGPGTTIIDTPRITVGRNAALIFVGGPATDQLIVRVRGTLNLRRQAAIMVAGTLTPEQVLFVVDKTVSAGAQAQLSGSVLARGGIQIGQGSMVAGQLLSEKHVWMRRFTTIIRHPFVGW